MTHQNNEEIRRRRRATRALPGDDSDGGGRTRGAWREDGRREGAVAVRCGPAAAAREQIKEGGKSAQAYDKKALEHSKRK
jgi:hypothetical protein